LGKIFDSYLEFKEQLDSLVALANKVNTRDLQRNLEAEVYENFRALIPLADKYTIVGQRSDGPYYKSEIGIGEWIRLKQAYHRYGSPVDDAGRAIQVLKENGDLIIPKVRKAISKEFIQLMDLLKKIVFYDNLRIEKALPNPVKRFTIDEHSGMTFFTNEIQKIGVESNYPQVIRCSDKANSDIWNWLSIRIVMTDMDYTYLVEDFYPQLVEILNEMIVMTEEKRKINDPLVKEMSETVIPFKFVKRLKA